MVKKVDFQRFKEESLTTIKNRGALQSKQIETMVQRILDDIRNNGDKAVIKYGTQFDKAFIPQNKLRVSSMEIESAYSQVDKKVIIAIQEIIKNITRFHEAQKRDLWYIEPRKGVLVGQLMRPLNRVGLYIPGGTAPYPSTVLMTVIPAKVAGVQEIILCTPPCSDGTVNPVILVAAQEAGADAVFKIGGVQAIGAMAFGTETVPAVSKIIGPGNIYVNTAKLLVNRIVGIDLPAGPSEVLIVADETSNPSFIAIDLISQAEHDENAYCFLITSSKTLMNNVEQEINRLLSNQARKGIITKALDTHSYFILIEKLEQAIELINEIAPEHLELQIQNADALLPRIYNAGAIFLGQYSPVPLGDYGAGTNHVLPTGGAAKIFSGLSITHYMKEIDVLKCSPEGLRILAPWIIALAKIEGLDAHAQSIQLRLE
ncbi:MAG: histidinol dehydrogenase [Candidatus Helarchaeota archaeon]